METDKINLCGSFDESFKDLYVSTDPKILKMEGISPDKLDVVKMSEKYFSRRIVDMSIDDNANAHESKAFGNYISEVTKGWLKIQGYYDIYKKLENDYGTKEAQRLLKLTWNGDIYLHDSTSIQIPYCWSYSTSFILFEGCKWGQLESKPPKHTHSFLDQVKEVTIEIAQEIAGAVAIGDLFVNYAYLAKKEGLYPWKPADRKVIEDEFQSLVHTLNKKLRASHQSPFSNLSIFDRPNLEMLFEDVVYPDMSKPDFDYIEEIQRIFCDWFAKGDPTSGLPYRFPVVTLNLRTDKNKKLLDPAAFEYYSKINLEKGCFNIYISSGNKIASCCRLTNDLDLAGVDSFGNGGVSLGSHRVVTLNLARLGKISKSVDDLKIHLHEQLENAKKLLIAHKQLLKQREKEGFLKFFKLGVMSMNRLFSTFGITGIYECVEQLGFPMKTEKGKNLAKEILEEIKNYATENSKKLDDFIFNVEQVPAESLAVKFAAKDQHLYNMPYSIYSNQFIPLYEDYDIVDRIKLDGEFSATLTGGGISHLNIGEKLTSKDQMKKLIDYSIKCGCEHFAVNYNFCKCVNNHITVAGPSTTCSICAGQIQDQYTRIIGYWVPVSSWNKGRQEEHKKRIFKKPFEQKKDSPVTSSSTQTTQETI
ncbi:MAG: anaerobic ribonucleoside-triphosphate reductase [bacterium]